MQGHRFFFALFAVFISSGMLSTAMAGMESLTDDQMGAVQGMSGTIVSAHSASPLPLAASDTPGIVNTSGAVIEDSGHQVFSPGSLSKDIHPTLSNQNDVLFSIHMSISSVTHHNNDTHVVDAWSGNRYDFYPPYNDLNP